MAFEASHLETSQFGHFLANVLPFYKLRTCFRLCPSRIKVCYRASLEGSQYLGMPCLFPYLPLLVLGLPLLFSVIKGIGCCLDHHIKRSIRVPASVAVVTLSYFPKHTVAGICPLKSPVPSKSLSPDGKLLEASFQKGNGLLTGVLSYC